MTRIVALKSFDLRFPTSRTLDGSDAMNPDPDYSMAYVILETDTPGLSGHGFTFTIGRGTEICVAAIDAYADFVVGLRLEEIVSDMGAFCKQLAGDSQLRWIGPEKGAIHLGLAAINNALWDLWGKQQRKPVWKLVSDLTPEHFVNLIDFTHIKDALDREDVLELLKEKLCGKASREADLRAFGYPAYTTSAGWLGYDEAKMRRLCRAAVSEGWQSIKIKIGRNLDDDIHRCRIAREEIGNDRRLMIDANQVWEVKEAVTWTRALAQFNPWWIEEPLSPDDILGHRYVAEAIRPIRVATGEHAHNRVMFKQFLTMDAIDVVQPDVCRLGGLNEALAVAMLAAKFAKPVCPHAGGVGLCELVQHLSMIDYVCISGKSEEAMTEYAGHLHEHFVNPVVLNKGRYQVPQTSGFSSEVKTQALADYHFPSGRIWSASEQAITR